MKWVDRNSNLIRIFVNLMLFRLLQMKNIQFTNNTPLIEIRWSNFQGLKQTSNFV